MARTRQEIEQELTLKFEKAATMAVTKKISVREAMLEMEKEEIIQKKLDQGITPLTPDIIQKVKDAGVECSVFGEDTDKPSLNVYLIPGARHAAQLARNGELNKASAKTRLMETILTCQKVATALGITLTPEVQE
jgi:hypothetical protein